ncbi:MAG: M17 family metallopeptidase [Puniceicoccaceae bacterium]
MFISPKITASTSFSPGGDVLHFSTTGGTQPDGISEREFSGRHNQLLLIHLEGRRELWVGLGDPDSINRRTFNHLCGTAARRLQSIGCTELTINLHQFADFVGPAVEGLIIALHKFDTFLPREKKSESSITKVIITVPSERLRDARKEIKDSIVLAEATNLARQIGDSPPNHLVPATLAQEAKKAAAKWGLGCRIWTESMLAKEGFGGILGVGQGSINPPRLIRLDYDAPSKKAPTLLVIGKAVTFDTGGISIKGRAGLAEMKWDKMGGCAALGIAVAAARLKIPINLTVLIPAVENMPDGKAFRPGDILSIYGGQTVEIIDTDAEGRLILADALAYGAAKIAPAAAITLATLTGACIVALGNQRAGLFTTNQEWSKQLLELGESCGDRVWPLPLGDEYATEMNSHVASIKNLGSREAGASSAASFLAFFAGKMPLIHLDIAGPAQITTAKSWLEEGATGFGVRLISHFARKFTP